MGVENVYGDPMWGAPRDPCCEPVWVQDRNHVEAIPPYTVESYVERNARGVRTRI